MSTKPIPDEYDALIPSIIVRDAAKAIEFYKEIFGATEMMRMNYPGSQKIAHAEIKIRNHVMMLGDENPQMGATAPQPGGPTPSSGVMIYVNDVDATFNKAVNKGAKSIMPPMDMFWGDRYGKFVDPFGHLWGIATHKTDVTQEQLAQGAAQWGKEKHA
jgi:PhnB protein